MLKNKKIQFYNYSIILVSIFPLLGLKKSALSIILFALFSIIIFFTEKNYKHLNRKYFLNFFVLSSYFLAYLVSFLFLKGNPTINKLLEQNLSFFVFPLCFIFNENSIYQKTFKKALVFFIISNVILAIYVWFKIIQIGVIKAFNQDNYYNPIIRNTFSEISEMHLPYIGMLFTFSGLILLNNIIKYERRKGIVFLNLFAIFILLFSVFSFASRMALFLFFLAALVLIYKELNFKKKTFFFVVSFFLILPVFFIPTIKSRILDLKTTKLVLPYKGQASDQVNFRYGIYNCTWKLIKENWLFGVGPTHVQEKLDECYSCYTYENKYDDFKNKTYNTHNQYADVVLKYGFFGSVFFLIFLFWGIKNNNDSYLIFLFIILSSMITENIFNRQIGIVFFNFFNTLFFVNFIKTKNNLATN